MMITPETQLDHCGEFCRSRGEIANDASCYGKKLNRYLKTKRIATYFNLPSMTNSDSVKPE